MNVRAFNFYSTKISSVIDSITQIKENAIIVLVGLEPFIDRNDGHITDLETFGVNGNETIFSTNWAVSNLQRLLYADSYSILSLAQFYYLIKNLPFLKERVILIKDNIRQLYPIPKQEYIDNPNQGDAGDRPESLPDYEAGQIKLGENYYYIASSFEGFETINLFSDEIELETDNAAIEGITDIDTLSEIYAIDLAVNKAIYEQNSQNIYYRVAVSRTSNGETLLRTLRQANAVLHSIGGGFILQKEPHFHNDRPNTRWTATDLLHRYWGDNTEFRTLSFYNTPGINKDLITVSQGEIVERIIQEYENAKTGSNPRDFFITAPTGAGKSLLFQLPAFYVSEQEDVTIVISPLKALMQDQVQAIINNRGFNKVAFINSELSIVDRNRIIEECQSGGIDLLYMAPELLLSYDISHFIGARRLGLVIIDEAHLITTWGRDFRVDYWFLGNHIKKIRKYSGHSFPMVAVTATAVYGGDNDMVFKSINDLAMSNPYIYIGNVKRDNISFIINNRDIAGNDTDKVRNTVQFIKEIVRLNLKTIVYAPYTQHVIRIKERIQNETQISDSVECYYGDLDPTQKRRAYNRFKNNEAIVMICTKAFGMGVDIPDIQIVYHHAPSGILPDYVQEIGRVARNPNIQGIAALDYSPEDQRYSKALYGMSAIRLWQLQATLKKISQIYRENSNRNFLIAPEDFDYIFANNSTEQIRQKVLTALMMIEKDYLYRYRYNVLIARPKMLFTTVYARIQTKELNQIRRYNVTPILDFQQNGESIIQLSLDNIWQTYFQDRSFPLIKRDFYNGTLFGNNIHYSPVIKISYYRFNDFNTTINRLTTFFDCLTNILSNFRNRFFQLQEFAMLLVDNNCALDYATAEKLGEFILSTYAETPAFITKRRVGTDYEYQIFEPRYQEYFTTILRLGATLLQNNDSADRFVSKERAINYIRLGYFLEMLDIGSFKSYGGENPMIFIRVNNPEIIARDATRNNYANVLLEDTQKRHDTSNQLFDHFFMHSMSDEDRWNFIEDFFLGENTDYLVKQYHGGESNASDIIQTIEQKSLINPTINQVPADYDMHVLNIFPARENETYDNERLLTIKTDNENGIRTMKVCDWINKSPKDFDQESIKFHFLLPDDVSQALLQALRRVDPEYYKKRMGLNLTIDFFGKQVKASIPYSTDPVRFYNWWKTNRPVYLSPQEKINLFTKVYKLNPRVLSKRDLKILKI